MLINIFDNDAFSAVSLTAAIQNTPFKPQFLGSLGIGAAEPSNTLDIAIEEEDGALTIIGTSPRGSAPEQSKNTKRKMRKATCVHLSREAVIMADEVAGVRAFGTESEMMTAERLVNSRVEGPFGLRAAMELTHEYQRLGMIKGIVYDADGSTELFNWFDFFGISAPAEVDMDLDNASPAEGVLADKCQKIKRDMVKALTGLPLMGLRMVALCGDNFFDNLTSHPEYKETKKIQASGNAGATDIIAGNKAYESIEFGGITWVNYRGTEDGKVGIHTDKAQLFPMGVDGLFRMPMGYADTWDFVNTPGLPLYLLQRKERQTDSMRVFEVQSNPLPMCLRPKALRTLKRT